MHNRQDLNMDCSNIILKFPINTLKLQLCCEGRKKLFFILTTISNPNLKNIFDRSGLGLNQPEVFPSPLAAIVSNPIFTSPNPNLSRLFTLDGDNIGNGKKK